MAWSSTLAAAIDDAATTVRLASPFAPLRFSNYITIDSEALRVTGAGGEWLSVERGALGSEPAAHLAGATVTRFGANTSAGGTASQGPAGPVGPAGPQGPPGEAGAQGPAGAAGPAGTQGPTGPQGATGDVGPAGIQGLQGLQGPQGLPGTAGAQGPQGLQGLPGTAGPQGLQGIQGLPGTAGPQGIQGPAGPAGGTVLVKSGLINLPAGGSAVVTFTTPFPTLPHVQVTSQFNSADTSTTLSVFPVSTSGFTIRGAGNAAGTVAWIATNAGNT